MNTEELESTPQFFTQKNWTLFVYGWLILDTHTHTHTTIEERIGHASGKKP